MPKQHSLVSSTIIVQKGEIHMAYNYYRKRHYNRSKNQNREYAEQMDDLWNLFQNEEPYKQWSLSTRMDSAYYYDSDREIEIRLSNHSADNKYHDLHNTEYLFVNVQASKLDFKKMIDNDIKPLLQVLDTLDLSKYRFINVTKQNINCFYKNYKTKKDVIPR